MVSFYVVQFYDIILHEIPLDENVYYKNRVYQIISDYIITSPYIILHIFSLFHEVSHCLFFGVSIVLFVFEMIKLFDSRVQESCCKTSNLLKPEAKWLGC